MLHAPRSYLRTANGVIYEEISLGRCAVRAGHASIRGTQLTERRPFYLRSGEQAKAGDNIQFDYTLRRANGYFIYATVACGIGCGDGTPEVAQLGKTALIAGLEELLTGMRPGEKRRALIPPALGYARCVESKGRHQGASYGTH